MADDIDFDFTDLKKLVADLGKATVEIVPNVRKAVEVSARTAKDLWREDAARLNRRHARLYPRKVSYDMELGTDGVIGAEVGPVLGGQGSLGLIDAPQGTSARVARAVEKDFVEGLLKATEGQL